jgi:tRNA-splicing ligase RtcB
MGTSSYVLAGAPGSAARSFSSACHGAGRALSRTAARKRCQGEKVVAELEHQGVILRTGSLKGAAEEAPIAYKNVDKVVEATSLAGLARTVARLRPHICVKG